LRSLLTLLFDEAEEEKGRIIRTAASFHTSFVNQIISR
jgi:hypothetical protein